MSGRSACRGRAGAASAAGTHIGERLYPFIQGGVRQLDLASRRHSQWRRLLKRVLHAALLLLSMPTEKKLSGRPMNELHPGH